MTFLRAVAELTEPTEATGSTRRTEDERRRTKKKLPTFAASSLPQFLRSCAGYPLDSPQFNAAPQLHLARDDNSRLRAARGTSSLVTQMCDPC